MKEITNELSYIFVFHSLRPLVGTISIAQGS